MKRYLYIAAGAMIGAMLRLSISSVSSSAGLPFFTGTFLVNMCGAFFAGFILFRINSDSGHKKDFLITGLLGTFTTFSMLSYEQFMLLVTGDYILFIVYLVINLSGGLALASMGWKLSGGALR